jgi:hyaluronoglucosaminidase
VLWDNFPVNDALPGQLFLGPYLGRDPDALRSLDGVVLNLMPQASANRIPLATAAEFFADPLRYDPEAALQRAVASVAPDARCAAALRLLVEQQRGHPVIATSASAPELGRRVAAAFGEAADGNAVAELREHLLALAGNDAELRALMSGDPVLEDVAPWSSQLARLASAALLGLDALANDAERAAYEAAREGARRFAYVVAATVLPAALLPFAAGQGEPVDHFASLFAAIDRRLAQCRHLRPDDDAGE